MVLFTFIRNIARAVGTALLIGGEELPVQEIKTEAALERILETHGETGLLLFKHSTACPISLGAQREVHHYLDKTKAAGAGGDDQPHPPLYLVKVIEARPVSNAIAERFGVQHQSPQLLLIHNQSAVWDVSHGGITSASIQQAVQEYIP